MRSSKRLVELTVEDYAQYLASGDPAPGGGSAAALTGGLAAALVAMVARLTIGRKAYAEHEIVMQMILDQADRLRGQLLALVDADAVAYQNLMAAYRLPRHAAEALEVRCSAIRQALRHAIDIPLATAEATIQVLNLAAQARQDGNKNAAGDAIVAALLAHAALLGAVHDVQINLLSLDDADFCAATKARVAGLVAHGEVLVQAALTA